MKHLTVFLLTLLMLLMVIPTFAQQQDEVSCVPTGEVSIPVTQEFFILRGVVIDRPYLESNYVDFCAVVGELDQLDSYLTIEGIGYSDSFWLVNVYDSTTLEFIAQGWFNQEGVQLNDSLLDSSFFDQ